MSTRINKRVLVFVDEHGTAGQPGFALGCVVVFGRNAGRADKALSDNLAATAKEIHAAELGQRHVGTSSGISTPRTAGQTAWS